jgi:hypothetical protein
MSFTGQNPRFRSTILTDIGVASIANPAAGTHRIINRGGTLQVQDDTGLETAIGAGGTVDKVTQTAHGFSVGEILYYTGSAYARALANAANTSEIVGMVSRVIDANIFEITLEGKVTGLSGLTAGEAYFLSPTVSGAITATEPSVLGHVSLPIGVAISTTVIYVRSSRGAVVGSTNARTEIALFNNTTTNVQDASAYQAGELAGYVEIDATTDLKFFVSAPFARNGAGTDYNISPQYVGDTPPVGFDLIITTAGIIRVTLPNVTGFVSAKINYGLNVPAIGATFPLAIDSTLVQFSTLKAKDSGGFVFQENGGTQIGSWSDTGALTIGPTSGTLIHKLQSGNTDVQIIGTGVSSNQVLDFIANGVSTFNIASGPGIGTTWFRTNNSSIVAGQVSTTGAWTFGPNAGGVGHAIYGRDGNPASFSHSLNIRSSSAANSVLLNFGTYETGDYAWIQSVESDTGNPKPLDFYIGSSRAMRFDSNGSARIGLPSGSSDATHYLFNESITAPVSQIYNRSSSTSSDAIPALQISKGSSTLTTSQKFIEFYINERSSGQGQINASGSSQVAFGTFSDIRLKENIQNLNGELNKILSLRPVEFDYKTGGHQIGFIAQEIQEIYPDVVSENPQDGMLVLTGWDKTTARLVKAIQELSARLVALENKGV